MNETAIDTDESNEALVGDEENQMPAEQNVQYMDDGFPEYNPADFEDHPLEQQ